VEEAAVFAVAAEEASVGDVAVEVTALTTALAAAGSGILVTERKKRN
jgi:hypothetical protein